MNTLALCSVISGLVPAIVSIGRYKHSPASYRPFYWFIWIGALSEAIALLCLYVFRLKSNLINSNIYVLVEFGILLWVFYRWNEAKTRKKYIIFFAIGLAIWVLDNLYLHSIKTINSQFRVYYCVVILFLSVNQLNKLIIFEKKNLLRNAMFLVCITFVCFFSYKAFVESFYLLEHPFSGTFYNAVFLIMQFVNLISNLVFSIAILCIPKRREFFTPS